MRYTRNALGLLNAQYRSVLKKCLLINLGLFALGASVSTAAAVTLSPTLDSLKAEAQKSKAVKGTYELNTTSGTAKVTINQKTYYFTPSSDKDLLQTLAGTSAGIITSKGGTPKSISFDVSKLPASVFEYETDSKTDYIALKTNNMHTSPNISWEKVEKNEAGVVTVKLPNKQTEYYKYTVDSDNYTLGIRLTDLTTDVGSATEKVLFNGLNLSDSSEVKGGAINNTLNGGYNIYADFIGNHISVITTSSYAKAYGGAIYNGENGTIGNITGDFIGNYASATATTTSSDAADDAYAYGGAIYNSGTIGDIIGDFIGNYVSATATTTSSDDEVWVYANGGAIYNIGAIGNITGDFIGNYATSSSAYASYAYGGAIYNSGTIGNITGDFIGNYVSTETDWGFGGAIYNDGTIGDIIGDFIGNHAVGKGEYGYAYGGEKSTATIKVGK